MWDGRASHRGRRTTARSNFPVIACWMRLGGLIATNCFQKMRALKQIKCSRLYWLASKAYSRVADFRNKLQPAKQFAPIDNDQILIGKRCGWFSAFSDSFAFRMLWFVKFASAIWRTFEAHKSLLTGEHSKAIRIADFQERRSSRLLASLKANSGEINIFIWSNLARERLFSMIYGSLRNLVQNQSMTISPNPFQRLQYRQRVAFELLSG